MQVIKKHVLKNGLSVFFLNDTRYTTSTVFFGFNVGWRNDKDDYEGLAHLFEHLVGKRTEKFPNKGEFDAIKDKNGIRSNAFTFADYTYYFQNQLNENLIQSLPLMFESIYNSTFNAEDLELEKKVVLTEAQEYKEDDYKLLGSYARKQVFKNHPYSKFFFGNKKTLSNITLKDFENFYKIYKNPKNATLIVTSSNDKYNEEILRYAENFKGYNNENYESLEGNANLEIKSNNKKRVYKKKGKNQSDLMFSFVSPQTTLVEKVQFKYIENLLGNSHSSKILNKLRDGLGVIYWFEVFSINWKDFSEVIFYTKTNNKNVDKIIKEVDFILDNLSENLTQEDISNVIEKIKFAVVNGIVSVADSEYVFETQMTFNEVITTEKFLEIIKETKVDDVKNLFKKILNKKNLNISILTA